MRVLLVRHGDAEPVLPGGSDSARPLSPRGHIEVEEVAERLRAHDERPTVVLTSPLVRAHETAEILGRILGAPVETADELSTAGDPRDMRRLIEARGEPCIAVVGHEPSMGDLHALLVGRGSQPFRKAEVRIIDGGAEVFRGGPW